MCWGWQTVLCSPCTAPSARPDIEKVAAYEPLLFLDQPGLGSFLGLMQKFHQQLAEGRLGRCRRHDDQVPWDTEIVGLDSKVSASTVPELRDASRGREGQRRRRATAGSPPHHP